jgi:hypothetical protein
VTGVNGSLGVLSGIQVGLKVYDSPISSLVIGGTSFDLSHSIGMSPSGTRRVADSYLDMQYSGLSIEYSRHLNDKLSVSLESLLGAGLTSLKDRYRRTYDSAPFLLVEPGVSVSGEFAPFLKLGVGFSYRIGSPVHMQGLDRLGTGGPSAMLSLTIG